MTGTARGCLPDTSIDTHERPENRHGRFRASCLACVIMLAAGAGVTAAQESGLRLSGELAADAVYTVTEPSDADAGTESYTGASTFRLDASGGRRRESLVQASVLARLVVGDGADAIRAAAALAAGGGTSGPALAALLYGTEDAVALLEVRTLYLSVYTRFADISVGRMILNRGKGTVFSPVDLFSQVDTSDLGLGRMGSDAARLLVPLGNFSGVEAISHLALTDDDGVTGLRVYGTPAGWDTALSAFGQGLTDSSGYVIAGLDAKGDLLAGVSAEAVARIPVTDWTPDASDAVYSFMLGADYSFGGALVIDLEYLANVRAGDTYAPGMFRSAHNMFASASWQVDDLTALDLRAIAVPDLAVGSADADETDQTGPFSALQVTLSAARSIATGANLVVYALYRSGDVEGVYLGTATPDAGDTEALAVGVRLAVRY